MTREIVSEVNAMGSVTAHALYEQDRDRLCQVSLLIAKLDQSGSLPSTATKKSIETAKLVAMLELSNRDVRQFCRLCLGDRLMELVDCLLVSRKLVNELYRYFGDGAGRRWNSKKIFDALMGLDNFCTPAEVYGSLELRLLRRQLVILHVLYSIVCVARQKMTPQDLLFLDGTIAELSPVLKSNLEAMVERVKTFVKE